MNNTAQPKRNQYTLITREGTRQVYGSRLEAEAERIRKGGGSIQPS